MRDIWTPRENDKFYTVKQEEIVLAEEKIGVSFPSELRAFYLRNGYGFIDNADKNINRIIDPISVADLRLRENEYEFYEDLDLYEDYEDGKLLFFEANEGVLFSIEITDNPTQKVFFYGNKIADSLEEFLYRYTQDNYCFKKYYS